MKLKPLLYLSAVLNVLFAILLAFGNRSSEEQSQATPKWTPPEEPESVAPSDEAIDPVPIASLPDPSTNPTFRWSQIESEDYAKYVKNLRSVGCPESTIQDIVEADINSVFEMRYHEVLHGAQTYDDWRHGPKHLAGRELVREQLRLLDEERTESLRAILGEDYVAQKRLSSASHDEILERRSIGFLSVDQQETVVGIQSEYDALERQLRLDLAGPENVEELRDELAAQRVARREALAAVLSEEELFELDIRDSHAADSIRSKLRGFDDVSEEEFREMFALRQQYELDQGETPDYSDPEKISQRNLARQDLESGYREVLGENRYVDLQRKNDRDWQKLKELEDSAGLSRDVMGQAYDLRKEAALELRRSALNPELGGDERAALVAAAQSHYRREMEALVGADNFDAIGELPNRTGTMRISAIQSADGAPVDVMMMNRYGLLPNGIDLQGVAAEALSAVPDDRSVQVIETRVISSEQPTAILIDPTAIQP